MKRSEKIQLLRDLEKGKISLEKLTDDSYDIWHLRDGVYSPRKDDSVRYSLEQYQNYIKGNPSKKHILIEVVIPKNKHILNGEEGQN